LTLGGSNLPGPRQPAVSKPLNGRENRVTTA
jgi:hypothetical protein